MIGYAHNMIITRHFCYFFAFAAARDIADTVSIAVIKAPIAVTYLKPYSTGQIEITAVTVRNINKALQSLGRRAPIINAIIVRITAITVKPAVMSGEK